MCVLDIEPKCNESRTWYPNVARDSVLDQDLASYCTVKC